MSEDWYPSKWGSDDEIGALNLISSSKILTAARLVRSGKIYNLAHILENGIPSPPFHGQFLYSTFHRHILDLRSPGKKNDAGGMNTRLEMADHTGTHLDGLNHISIGERLYNGYIAEEITDTFGTTKLGMERTPPIFTRGVFLDIASLKQVANLEAGHAIDLEEIKLSLDQSRLSVMPGDAVMIRTGWARFWMSDNKKFLGPCPGIELSAAKFLVNCGAAVVGSDTWNVEVDPTPELRGADAVHQHLLTKNGVRMIENLFLEELANDKIFECLFVCLPLRIKGGTGSPITPVAII